MTSFSFCENHILKDLYIKSILNTSSQKQTNSNYTLYYNKDPKTSSSQIKSLHKASEYLKFRLRIFPLSSLNQNNKQNRKSEENIEYNTKSYGENIFIYIIFDDFPKKTDKKYESQMIYNVLYQLKTINTIKKKENYQYKAIYYEYNMIYSYDFNTKILSSCRNIQNEENNQIHLFLKLDVLFSIFSILLSKNILYIKSIFELIIIPNKRESHKDMIQIADDDRILPNKNFFIFKKRGVAQIFKKFLIEFSISNIYSSTNNNQLTSKSHTYAEYYMFDNSLSNQYFELFDYDLSLSNRSVLYNKVKFLTNSKLIFYIHTPPNFSFFMLSNEIDTYNRLAKKELDKHLLSSYQLEEAYRNKLNPFDLSLRHPNKEHFSCQICKVRFDDYKDHILSKKHEDELIKIKEYSDKIDKTIKNIIDRRERRHIINENNIGNTCNFNNITTSMTILNTLPIEELSTSVNDIVLNKKKVREIKESLNINISTINDNLIDDIRIFKERLLLNNLRHRNKLENVFVRLVNNNIY